MATIISTKTSGVGGLEVTGDATGILQLASNDGTTAITVDASQNVGIGTASPNSYGSTYKVLEVEGSFGGIIQASSGSVINEISGDSTAGFGFVGTRSNHPVIFKTNDTERMRIDASGRVIMPYQPSFHATHSNGSLSTGEIVWGNIVYNIGSYYNSSNGRFTAPVSGTYYFCAHTLIQSAPAGEVRMAIYKNGSGYGGLRFITIKPANSWWSIIAEGHVYMTAGDYVSIFMEQNPTTLYNDANYNSFSGNFIG